MDTDKTRVLAIICIVVLLSVMALFFIKLPVANVIWMKQGEVVNLLNYHDNTNISSVELIDVAGDNNRTKLCGFSVDGDQTWIEEGKDREINGVKIYVRQIILARDYFEDKDYCKVTFTKPIVIFNGSEGAETEETATEKQENASVNASNTSLPAATKTTANASTPEPEQNLPSSGTINISEEKPVRMSLFDIIVAWLKNLFSY